MKYVTKIHALNILCKLNTTGDWHWGGIQWDHPTIRESNGSFFGDYGLKQNKEIPYHNEKYNVANHIRALLDMLLENDFDMAQGMRDNFIDNDKYTKEIFYLVYSMNKLPNWQQINDFMLEEYKLDWYFFVKEKIKREKQMVKN